MIGWLPEGPTGFMVVLIVVTLATMLIMAAIPVIEWFERRQAKRDAEREADRQFYYNLEGLSHDGDQWGKGR